MERARRKPTESLQAYDYYLRALFIIYQFTRESNVEALRLAKIAISLDPAFARRLRFCSQDFRPEESVRMDRGCCKERVESRRSGRTSDAARQGRSSGACVVRASVFLRAGRAGERVAFLARAVALDPNLAVARNWTGWAQIYLGNLDAAIEQFSAAIRLSPARSSLVFAPNRDGVRSFLCRAV